MNHDILKGWKTIFCGFSGGADSLFLLLQLHALSSSNKFDLKVVHFEHGIRGSESIADAAWCEDFCTQQGLNFHCQSLNVPSKKRKDESVESAARRLRLESWRKLLAEETSKNKVKNSEIAIALAHHANDRIENLFIRLLRGANTSGLSSMRVRQKLGDLNIIRPILSLYRSEIVSFLRKNGYESWREDSTNQDKAHTRNWLRHDLLTAIKARNPEAETALLHSISALDEDANFLEQAAADAYQLITNTEQLSIDYLNNLHPALFVRILRIWLSERLEKDYVPNHHTIDRVRVELARFALSKEFNEPKILIPIKDGPTLRLHSGKMTICDKSINIEPDRLWRWQDQREFFWNEMKLTSEIATMENCENLASLDQRDSTLVYFDAEEIPSEIKVRSWTFGDSMIPFGSSGPVKLKKLFAEKKIASEDKNHYPICEIPDEKIIWVPAIRRSNHAIKTSKTSKIAIFRFIQS